MVAVGKSGLAVVIRDLRWSLLVTYADEGEGHTGAIYLATNWTPAGTSKSDARWVDAAGKRVAKFSTRSRSVAEMFTAGHAPIAKSCKRRFVKIVRGAEVRCRAAEQMTLGMVGT